MKETMTHIDLFTGFGGWPLAAHTVWREKYLPLAFCELDESARRELRRCWPSVCIHQDVLRLNGKKYRGVDILTGSPPCQPFSRAGRRLGRADDRALWSEMFRVIKEARPDWICYENVDRVVPVEINNVIDDLESEGFEAQPFIVPAAAVGANHIRYRCWIVAHANGASKQVATCTPLKNQAARRQVWPIVERNPWQSPFAGLRALDDGLPEWSAELKGLGNAIVPQVAMRVLDAIRLYQQSNGT